MRISSVQLVRPSLGFAFLLSLDFRRYQRVADCLDHSNLRLILANLALILLFASNLQDNDSTHVHSDLLLTFLTSYL